MERYQPFPQFVKPIQKIYPKNLRTLYHPYLKEKKKTYSFKGYLGKKMEDHLSDPLGLSVGKAC